MTYLHPLIIGHYELPNNLVLAPMAGVADLPWRNLCRHWGAGYAVGEMLHSRLDLLGSGKSQTRTVQANEPTPIAIQLLGNDPQMMAQAARHQVAQGAHIIDLNMGCPAKKVAQQAAGSALLNNEPLVAEILRAVVTAVTPTPVTLKIRTGVDQQQRNAVQIARIAQEAGIALLTVHGRTKADKFLGQAEYDTIAEVVQAVEIPVIANGDIDTPEIAQAVLKYTQAQGIMIGRGANGRPWLFQQIAHYLDTGEHLPDPDIAIIYQMIQQHYLASKTFYGDEKGRRIFRKHLNWYAERLNLSAEIRHAWLQQTELSFLTPHHSHRPNDPSHGEIDSPLAEHLLVLAHL